MLYSNYQRLGVCEGKFLYIYVGNDHGKASRNLILALIGWLAGYDGTMVVLSKLNK